MIIRHSCRGFIDLTQAVSFQDKQIIRGDIAEPLTLVSGTPPPPPPSGPEGNIYFQKSLQAELTISKYKGATVNTDV